MAAKHELTEAERRAWLERNTFECPVYRARVSPQSCASNRRRPLLTEVGSIPPEDQMQLHRRPGCGDDCPTWQEQKGLNVATSTSQNTKRATCAWCGRENMAIVARGLDGACYKLANAGKIAQAEDGTWYETGTIHPKSTPAPDLSSAFGPLAEQEGEHAAELIDAAGTPAQVPAGDLSIDLANPKGVFNMPGQAPPVLVGGAPIVEHVLGLMGADPDGELITETEADQLLEQAKAQDAETEADDWQEYTGVVPAPVTSPMLTLDKRGRFGITACGVREFGISAPYVRPLWSPTRGQIGLRFQDQPAPGQGVLKCSRSDKHLLHFHAVGFLRQFGITLAPGQYPLQREPSGLLVATIDIQPREQGQAEAS